MPIRNEIISISACRNNVILNYVYDTSLIDREKEAAYRQLRSGYKSLSTYEIAQAKKFVIDSLNEFYYPFNVQSRIINADFYSNVLGDHRIPENFRYKRGFITETITEEFPNCKFHFKQRRTSYTSDNYYDITRIVNNEIIKSSKYLRSEIKKDILLQLLFEKYSIEEEEVLRVIKKEFPKLRFYKDRIITPKPWRGKKKNN